MKPKTGHSWTFFRKFPWPYCKRCGLVHLKNKATEVAVRKGCDADKD